MKRINSYVKYQAVEPVLLDTEDYIKVVKVTEDGDIVLRVNNKLITLVQYEKQINLNI